MSMFTSILSAVLLIALLILNNSENQTCSLSDVSTGNTYQEQRPQLKLNQPLFHRGSGRSNPCTS